LRYELDRDRTNARPEEPLQVNFPQLFNSPADIASASRNKAPEKLPYAIKRYSDKVDRLYSVLEDGLSAGKGKWLVGDKYSAVDINGTFCSSLEDITDDVQLSAGCGHLE